MTSQVEPTCLDIVAAMSDATDGVCHSLVDSMKWFEHACDKVAGQTSPQPVMDAITNRILFTSNSFSGIDGDGVSDSVISGSAKAFVERLAPGSQLEPVKFVALFAIEVDPTARQELLLSGPKCIFGDICSFLTDDLRRKCGYDGGIKLPAKE